MRAALAIVALAAIVATSQITSTAGTTGGLSGTVLSAPYGEPIANATVRVESSTQIASTHTDARGNFTFVSLTPDVYDVAVERLGFNRWRERGVVVFADSTTRISAQLSLATIVSVLYHDFTSLVKPRIVSDVYTYSAARVALAPQPSANYWVLRVTPGITFGAGAPVMH